MCFAGELLLYYDERASHDAVIDTATLETQGAKDPRLAGLSHPLLLYVPAAERGDLDPLPQPA
jgi:hypothetical protein